MHKAADAFRTISEVADDLSLPQHVLRFWETRFPQIRPLKRAGGRRYYRPADVLLLRSIRQLLYDDGYTIKGVQRLLKEQGAKRIGVGARTDDPDPGDDLMSDSVVFDDMTHAITNLVEPASRDPGPRNESSGPRSAAEPTADHDTTSRNFRDLLQETLSTIEDCRSILDAALGAPDRRGVEADRAGPQPQRS